VILRIKGRATTLLEKQPEWRVCGEACNGREAVEKAKQLMPDVIIMDISMPGLNGLEATRQIVRANPSTKVLILTLHDSEQVVHDVLDAGARGFLMKSDPAIDIEAVALQSILEDSGGTALKFLGEPVPASEVFFWPC
jgi:DNA-binding NarL/FixJ family response regulator